MTKAIRDQLKDAEAHPDEAFTPGNLSALCGRLEAARCKAYALRGALAPLVELQKTCQRASSATTATQAKEAARR